MTRAVRQIDVQKIVAGAIKGGLAPGSFGVSIDAEAGVVRLYPLTAGAPADENALDGEIRKLMDG